MGFNIQYRAQASLVVSCVIHGFLVCVHAYMHTCMCVSNMRGSVAINRLVSGSE